MEELIQDVRFAFRLLSKSPGFTLTVVLALGIGIGTTSAVFSIIDTVLLRPLPYPEPDRLVQIWMRFTGIGIPKDQNWVSAPEFVELRDQNRSFSHIAAYSLNGYSIKINSVPERVDGAVVSASFFALLGAQASLGRAFLPADDQPGHENIVVLSHALWERRFGADRAVLGKSLVMNARQYTIVGIAPVGFQFPPNAELWTPLSFSPNDLGPNSRGNHGLMVIARIQSGTSFEQARSDMQALSQRIVEQNPGYPYGKFDFRIVMNPLLEELVGDMRTPLWLLMGAVGFVLLIACANVANLLLARASARGWEITVRAALGASRARVMRQLLTESVILSLLGSVVGILLARLGLATLLRLGPAGFSRNADIQVDVRVLGFTLLIALGTGILFGIAPALQASRNCAGGLKEGGRGASAAHGLHRMRHALVVAEIALSLILLVGAGLLMKSFTRVLQVDPGFRPDGVLTLRITLPQNSYSEAARIRTFIRELMDRIGKIPGVEAVGGVSAIPLSGSGSSGTTTVDSRSVEPEKATPEADWRRATPGYFSTMGIRLIRGRFFNDHDIETSPPVAIIDETMAGTYWPGEDPIGKRIRRGGSQSTQPWSTIVGVVGHVRDRTLEAPSRVQFYWPYAQDPARGIGLAVRTSLEPRALASAVQHEVMALDPDLPISTIRTMGELISNSMARRKFSMLLLAIFAGAALLLAVIGIYGVISYMVAQRTHEMGIRMALGANRSSLLRLVLMQSACLTVAGIFLGLLGSLVLSRMISSLLFDVSAVDPLVFLSLSGILATVAMLASLLPASRATKVDPMVVLRYE
jgi:putative ABC transport system permease protein